VFPLIPLKIFKLLIYMNAPGVILVIVVIFLLYMITTSDQSGAGPSPSQSPGPVSAAAAGPHYARQYRELEDVNTVLYRQQEPGVPAISALQAWNTNTETQLRLGLGLGLGAGSDVDELRSFVRPYETAPTQPTPDSTRVVVESKQPYFLDEALIIERDGEKYYWDWRYPRQPILIQFATDPEGYMRDHPNEYPSYVIESRDHSGL
jgi:hypothetical protein